MVDFWIMVAFWIMVDFWIMVNFWWLTFELWLTFNFGWLFNYVWLLNNVDFWIMGGETDKQTKKTDKDTHGHINTITRPGLRAEPSENS